MNNMIIKKFVKGFITGGLSAIGAALAVGVSAHTLSEAKSVIIVLATAFVSGGIHAVVEMLKPTLPATVESVVTKAVPTP